MLDNLSRKHHTRVYGKAASFTDKDKLKRELVPFQFDFGQVVLNYLEWRNQHKDEMDCPDPVEVIK